MLTGALLQSGVDVLRTFEPGDTPLGRRLRDAFLETEETVSPMAELLLFAADRAQHVEFLIRPALTEGRVVISDRYADATFAYQGAGRGFDEDIVNRVIQLATGGLKPDMTIFFDIPVQTALTRMNASDELLNRKVNRMDFEETEFYARGRAAYHRIADSEPERVWTIDASSSVEDIHRQVLNIVTKRLKTD
jgi:dTMP kinase